MHQVVNFPLPDDLQERLLFVCADREPIKEMIRKGSPQVGRALMDYHREIDRLVSRDEALKLLDLDPKSEDGIKARKALYDPDRLFGLIGHWYQFMLDGPPVPEDFVEKAREWFPTARDLMNAIEDMKYEVIQTTLFVAPDMLLGKSILPQRSNELVLGLDRDASWDERHRAAQEATVLFQYFWTPVYQSYYDALRDLPLARQLDYVPSEPVAA